jgi:hypothetical protein
LVALRVLGDAADPSPAAAPASSWQAGLSRARRIAALGCQEAMSSAREAPCRWRTPDRHLSAETAGAGGPSCGLSRHVLFASEIRGCPASAGMTIQIEPICFSVPPLSEASPVVRTMSKKNPQRRAVLPGPDP